MGKGKAGNKKGAGRKVSSTKTAAQLYAMAQELMERMDVDAAIRCLEKAIAQEADHVECLHLLGELYAECMETEKAKAALQQLLQAVPEEPSALLYLGQLCEGAASAEFYRRAIASMASQLRAVGAAAEPSQAELQAMQSGNTRAVSVDVATVRRRIAAACCSLVELHMTDLCDEPNAEAVCEECLTQALATDPLNPEVQHQVASLRLVQQRPADAQAAMHKAAQLLEVLLEAADEAEEDTTGVGTQASSAAGGAGGGSGAHSEGGAGGGPPDAAWVPTHAARKAMAQTCLEVELWDLGIPMLERLLSEHDVDFELWFLLTEAYMGGGDLGTAGLYVNEATRRLQGAVDIAAGKSPGGAAAAGGGLFGMLAASGGGGASAALKELGPQGAVAALKQFGRLADALRAAAAAGGVDLAAAIAAAEAEGDDDEADEGGEGGAAGLQTAVAHAVATAQAAQGRQ